MSETAYKAVSKDLESLWIRNADKISYSVGDDFEAAHTGAKGIFLVPELDWAKHLVMLIGTQRGTIPVRYLQVSYELGDVFTSVMRDDAPWEFLSRLTVAAVHVVAEVT